MPQHRFLAAYYVVFLFSIYFVYYVINRPLQNSKIIEAKDRPILHEMKLDMIKCFKSFQMPSTVYELAVGFLQGSTVTYEN